MPPRKIWALRGGSAQVQSQQKHSARLTAVLTVRADGTKLPISFIVKGCPGGPIELDELPSYPPGHVLRARKSVDDGGILARLPSKAAQVRAEWSLRHPAGQPRLSHFKRIRSYCERGAFWKAVSIITTLDFRVSALEVGVMGPLKAQLRSLWLEGDHNKNDMAAEKRRLTIDKTILVWEGFSEIQ